MSAADRAALISHVRQWVAAFISLDVLTLVGAKLTNTFNTIANGLK
jgi:hypothetical protein